MVPKHYFQMDDLGGFPPIFGSTPICWYHFWQSWILLDLILESHLLPRFNEGLLHILLHHPLFNHQKLHMTHMTIWFPIDIKMGKITTQLFWVLWRCLMRPYWTNEALGFEHSAKFVTSDLPNQKNSKDHDWAAAPKLTKCPESTDKYRSYFNVLCLNVFSTLVAMPTKLKARKLPIEFQWRDTERCQVVGLVEGDKFKI